LKQGVCTLPASLGCLKSGLSIMGTASPLSLFNFPGCILPEPPSIRKILYIPVWVEFGPWVV
jgi:hypothetical protein